MAETQTLHTVSSEWICVERKSRKYNNGGVKSLFYLTSSEIEHLDDLSKIIYNILIEHNRPLPASYITKQINGKGVEFEKYTKKHIGDILYEGGLSTWLIRNNSRPTLWTLPKERINMHSPESTYLH